MDFITRDQRIGQRQTTLDPSQLLFRFQRRLKIQQSQSRTAAQSAFQPCWIVDPAPQHLKAAANADQLAAVAQVAMDSCIPALFAQPLQIAASAFTARQDD